LKVSEWVQNGGKKQLSTEQCEDPNSARRRYEENRRKAEDLLQWCEVHVAKPKINWLGTRQEKVRKTQKDLPKSRQEFFFFVIFFGGKRIKLAEGSEITIPGRKGAKMKHVQSKTEAE